MERKTKMWQSGYYSSEVCVCGESKKENRWLCLDCRDMMKDSPEEQRLNIACDRHTLAAQDYLAAAELKIGK